MSDQYTISEQGEPAKPVPPPAKGVTGLGEPVAETKTTPAEQVPDIKPGERPTKKHYTPTESIPARSAPELTEESVAFDWYPKLLKRADELYPNDPVGRDQFVEAGRKEGMTQTRIAIAGRNMQMHQQQREIESMLFKPLETG